MIQYLEWKRSRHVSSVTSNTGYESHVLELNI